MTDVERSQELVHRFIDGIATEDELNELGRAVVASPHAADLLARGSRIDSDLATVFGPPPLGDLRALARAHSTPRSGAPHLSILHIHRPSLRQLVAGTFLVVALAAALLIGLGIRGPLGPAPAARNDSGMDQIASTAIPASAPPLTDRSSSAPSSELLPDGSMVSLLSDDARLTRLEMGPELISLELSHAGARFEVVPRKTRTFRVRCRDVTVEVLGTIFSVIPTSSGVNVKVERGSVRVIAQAGTSVLQAGMEGDYPSAAPSVESAGLPPQESWRGYAKRGDFARAFRLLQREGLSRVPDDANDLLLASEAARRSGHPDQAVPPLRRMLETHRQDPRAPFAAFTLGRVLLEELDQPQAAAEAFARAGALLNGGALAEDALAREVESWARAGDDPRAKLGALRFVANYPHGTKVHAVRRWGGLP